jgi:hypothetical protein
VHPFCNLQSWVGTHAVLVIGLYELLDLKTKLIEPPGPLKEGIYYLYDFVPNNFKECDLDLKIA